MVLLSINTAVKFILQQLEPNRVPSSRPYNECVGGYSRRPEVMKISLKPYPMNPLEYPPVRSEPQM